MVVISPHRPLEAPQEYIDRFANTTGGNHARNMVCAMVAVLDSGVGNVTAALKTVSVVLWVTRHGIMGAVNIYA